MPDSYYHIYNRGVEKRDIFMDDQDYGVFLSYLRKLLTAPKGQSRIQVDNNFFQQVMLLCYCLMPNHFHLLIKQRNSEAIGKIIKILCTRYSMYFNKKYQRVGKLFQGVYKAVTVRSEEQLVYLTRYIHTNPKDFTNYKYSSIRNYLKQVNQVWVEPEPVLSMFSVTNKNLTYTNFLNIKNDNGFLSERMLID